MTLRSDTMRIANSNAGLSILEALIALAILAMVMGLSASAFRGPSPTLRLQKEAAVLIRTASQLRQRAIREGKDLSMESNGLACGEPDIPLSFFPDGTGIGPDLCLTAESHQLRLTLNALTGRLSQVTQ